MGLPVGRGPFNTQFSPIDPNWMIWNDDVGDPKFIQILMAGENFHIYIDQTSSNVNALKLEDDEDGECDKASQFLKFT